MNTSDGHGGEDHLAPVTDLFARKRAEATNKPAPESSAAADSGWSLPSDGAAGGWGEVEDETPRGGWDTAPADDTRADDNAAPAAEQPPVSTVPGPRALPGFADGEPIGGWEFDRAPRTDADGWWVPPTVAADKPARPERPQAGRRQAAHSSTERDTHPRRETPAPVQSEVAAPTRTESRPTARRKPATQAQPDNVVSLFGGRPRQPERRAAQTESRSESADPHTALPPLQRASDLLNQRGLERTREPLPWSTNDTSPASEQPSRSAPKRAPRLRVMDSQADAEPEQPTDDELRARGEAALLKKLRGKGLSVSEARLFLRGLDVPTDSAEDIIDEFLGRGYLGDEALAEQLVYQAVSKKAQGRRAIAMALSARGIPRELVEAALEELEDDDDDRALEFARAKARSMASLDREVALRRLLGQLARRGFAGSSAMTAAKTALDEVGGVRFR